MGRTAESRGYISIDGLDLMLRRQQGKSQVPTRMHPSIEGGAVGPSGIPVLYADASLGMGYKRMLFDRSGGRGGYSYGENVWTLDRGIVMPAGKVTELTLPAIATTVDATGLYGLGPIRCSAEFGGDLFLGGGDYILSMAGGSADPVVAGYFGQYGDVRGLAAFFDGSAYSLYAGGWGNTGTGSFGFMRVAPSQQKVNSTSGPVGPNRVYLTVVDWTIDGTSAARMVGTDAPSRIWHIAAGNDPMVAANWVDSTDRAQPLYVGATRTGGTYTAPEVVGLVSSPRHVYFIRPDGVFDITETGHVVNLLGRNWLDTYDGNNGYGSCWFDNTIITSHTQGAVRVFPSQQLQEKPEYIHFGAYGLPNETPISGRYTAFCPSGTGRLFAGVFDETDSYLVIGAPREYENAPGPGPYVWHGYLAKFAGELITHLRVHAPTSGNPVLLVCTAESNSTPHIYTYDLAHSATPLQDYTTGAGMKFATSWALHYSQDDLGSPISTKLPWAVDMTSAYLGAGNQVAVDVQADDSGTWTTQMTATESPFQSTVGPTEVSGKAIQYRITGTNSEDVPAVVRALQLTVDARVRHRKVVTFSCKIESGQTMANSSMALDDADTVLAQLLTLPSAGYVTLIDQYGRTSTGIVQSVIPTNDEEAPRDNDWSISVDITINILRTTATYSAGFTYDSGALYA